MRNSLLIAVVWLGFALIAPAASTGPVAPAAGVAKPYRLDRILIQPKPGVRLADLTRFHSQQGNAVRRTFEHIGNLQVLEVPAGFTAEQLIALYEQSGLVAFAEPDYTGQVFKTTPNDPKFLDGTLWGLNTNSAPLAWDVLTAASNIVVAVLDTGVRYTHEDLAANMWTNPNDGGHGWNAINGNNNPGDFGTHGTMVTGVLGAVGNNGKGVCGVAWRLQIMAGACFNGSGLGNVSDVVTCLDYARTNGARIINASWGFTNSLALSNAMVSLRDAGIIVVAACGNSATNIDLYPTYPASYALDNIVSVASTSKADVLSGFSNYGVTNVDLAAPGEQIYTTFPATDSFYYNDASGGTSYSAPYVSGALALLLAKFPTETYQQIIARLLNATDPLPSLAGKCVTGGRLNLAKALNPPIYLTASPFTGGLFKLHLASGPNRTCVIQVSTNLSTWLPIHTNTTAANGAYDFTNAPAPNVPGQFFRAVSSL